MPIYSMTGYASAQTELASDTANSPALRLGLEIRSVNSRFLDLTFKMPEELRPHEAAMRELITKHLKRGKVEIRANLESTADTSFTEPTPALLQRLLGLQELVHAHLPKANGLSVADVLRLATAQSGAPAEIGPAVLKLAQNTLTQLSDAREREGARLAQTLRERIGQLRVLATQAAPLVPQLVEQQRLKFLERWREAMALTEGTALPEAAQDRALTEATSFAIRIDVAEELARLKSHLSELEFLLSTDKSKNQSKATGSTGKRLDFLFQEMNREANTLGSKAGSLDMTRAAMDLKLLIEQMREQAMNIE